ncbi:MAG: hypothetical protein J7L22_11490, partial [Candidatus Marinimicrobia bacterium]|nr:hypothetical protein [Candidatus Neomarinimicrobiota bacterium]
AYSSIGQIGLIVFAFSISTQLGVAGGLFQMVSHTLGKALLFLCAGYMIFRTGSMEISSLEGIGKKMPLTALCFTIGTFSIVGLPPFTGFASKFMIIRAALANGELLLQILIGLVLVGTIIEGAYFFKIIQTIYFKGAQKTNNREEAPVTALIPMLILVSFIIVIGMFPNIIDKVLQPAASELLDQVKYIGSVLG